MKGIVYMSIFSKPEITILKESSDAKLYLEKLENLLPKTKGNLNDKIQKEIAITKAGIIGEENILFELKHCGMDLCILHDIYIETNDGRGAQLDFVVFATCGTFIIECKNLFGNIEIDSNGNFIRTIEYNGKRHKEGIYSPITQSERHLSILNDRRNEDMGVLNKLLSSPVTSTYHSLVVLANPKTIVNDRFAKKEIKNKVIRADQLINLIKKIDSETSILFKVSKKDIKVAAQSLLEKNVETRKDYYSKYMELEKELSSNSGNDNELNPTDDSNLICPKCGSTLVLRTARNGINAGQKFYGCSSFPNCRYILNIKQ